MVEEQLNHIVGENVSRETLEKLHQYRDLLLKWNKSINLVSKTTENDVWVRHFLDSAQIYKFVQQGGGPLYDLGSGAGFPGMVLALLFGGTKEIGLVESDQRKCLFLKNVSRETFSKVNIYNERIERFVENVAPPQIVVCRALGSLDKIFDLTAPWFVENANLKYCLLKGASVEHEINAAKEKYNFKHSIEKSISSDEGSILNISSVTLR
jgi:16S rRNA (guanine527-N7)-methyltransferase